MAAPGRNDPCPCGSGKKYKHCHLVAAQAATGITPSHRSEAIAALMKYSMRPELDDIVLMAALMWMGDTPDDDPRDALQEILSLDASRDAFFEWLFFDLPLDDQRPMADHLLARQAWTLHPRVAEYMRLMLSTEMRPYQIRDVTPGEGLRVRDLWSGEELDVHERAGSRQLVVWDVLVARVHLHADGTRQIEGSPIALPTSTARRLPRLLKAQLRGLRKKEPDLSDHRFFKMVTPVFHLIWHDEVATAPMPELRTPEGDPYVTSTLEFEVPRAGDALTTLLEHDDFEPGPPGVAAWVEPAKTSTRMLGEIEVSKGTLVLRTWSKARAERGRARLEAVLGPLHLRKETHEAPDLTSRRSGQADRDDEFGTDGGDGGAEPADPMAMAEVAALLAEHDRQWVDMSIPALDGATPREAAKSRRLRPRLVDLLVDLENRTARLALRGTARDVSWMWTELGVKRP